MSTDLVEQAYREVVQHAKSLLDLAVPADEFRRRAVALATAIESCPMGSAEFGLANQRLRNALEYFKQGELGAAGFEIKQLRSQIEPLGAQSFVSLFHCPVCGQPASLCPES